MPWLLRNSENGREAVESTRLGEQQLKALSGSTRKKILEILSSEESYPSEISKRLGLGKQQVYYHFEKLEENDLIEKTREEQLSGGTASFYTATDKAFHLDLGSTPDYVLPETEGRVRSFLEPLVTEASLNGSIVVGSPDEHGEDRVRARDGHLAGEIGLTLGKYADSDSLDVKLDTEVVRSGDFERNMILLGGVLTNTLTKKFNEDLPVSFPTESFPYHGIETSQESYSDGSIGVVAKTSHPQNDEKAIFLVAGVRSRGTKAAVVAFKNLEEILECPGDEFYRIVRGRDRSGDGEIDSFEVVE